MTTALSGFEELSGDEWQKLCMQVMHIHHGPGELIEVPDHDRGDAGIEAFSLNGCVYACYAPQPEPLTTAVRRKKQIDKLDSDIAKFVGNEEKLKAMFPPDYQVGRWTLLVPYLNTKDVHVRASTKTAEVRSSGLSYVASSIVVKVETLNSYDLARRTVVAQQLAKVHLPAPVDLDYSDVSDPQIDKMHEKLAKTALYSDSDRRSAFVDRLLRNLIAAQHHRAFIGDHYSELADALDEQMADLEARLGVQYPLNEPNPDRMLSSVLQDTEQLVGSGLNTSDADSRTIAEGQIADWLMRCPLDFYS